MLTGFRVHPAGKWGRQVEAGFGYTPDILTYGKVVGGGMPLAALGGSREVMEQLAPTGPVYQAGTLSGNPLSVAAGLKTLELATPDVNAHLDAAADRVIESLAPRAVGRGRRALDLARGVAVRPRLPGRAKPGSITPQAKTQDAFRFTPFFHVDARAGREPAAERLRGVVRHSHARR